MSEHIGVVGAGLIGRSWSIVFARAGYDVSIYDDAPHVFERCLAPSFGSSSRMLGALVIVFREMLKAD